MLSDSFDLFALVPAFTLTLIHTLALLARCSRSEDERVEQVNVGSKNH